MRLEEKPRGCEPGVGKAHEEVAHARDQWLSLVVSFASIMQLCMYIAGW